MSKNQRHGGKSGHDDHDGHDSGHHQKVHVLIGTRDDDPLTGTDGKDIIRGKKGDDHIDGGAGNDLLFGDKGNDKLFGGDGNDKLFGGKGNDFLDGGAGSDYLFGDKGNDTFNFSAAENLGAKDYYDGGKGFDTLQLTLTAAEAKLAAGEIEAFEAFLKDGHGAFHFESFGLTVRNFEALDIVTIGNTAPVAENDPFSTDEDTPIGGDVLANDKDAEDGRPVLVSAVNGDAANVGATITLEGSGALLTVNADGTFVYDTNDRFEHLGDDQFVDDSFTYVAQDSQGLASNVATVSVRILGVNDAPVAFADSFEGDVGAAIVGTVLDGDFDAESDPLTAVLDIGPSMGGLVLNPDGSFVYTPNAGFVGTDSFSYKANDGSLDSVDSAIVTLTVNEVNEIPQAGDDVIVGAGSAGGTVRVAVIGGAVNFADEVNAWLNDSVRGFDFQAVALPTSSDWTSALTGIDVAVIGDDGFSSEYDGAAGMFAALRDFVDSGHGVVSTGWFAGRIGTYTGGSTAQINLDADYISPAADFGSQVYVPNTSTIVVDPSLPVHPITDGVRSYQVQGFLHEVAGRVDSSGGLNGTVVVHAHDMDTQQAAIISATGVGTSGNANTVFLGSLHMAGNPAYGAEDTLTGDPAKILEQAIAWATGEAATDEDTPRVIDVNALLANDTDAEGDAFNFDSVASFSARGAALSFNADSNIIVYDPTGAAELQALDAGEIGDDWFNYTIIDGSGRTDTAKVSLKVLGVADAAAAPASFEETVVAGLENNLAPVTSDVDALL